MGEAVPAGSADSIHRDNGRVLDGVVSTGELDYETAIFRVAVLFENLLKTFILLGSFGLPEAAPGYFGELTMVNARD